MNRREVHNDHKNVANSIHGVFQQKQLLNRLRIFNILSQNNFSIIYHTHLIASPIIRNTPRNQKLLGVQTCKITRV